MFTLVASINNRVVLFAFTNLLGINWLPSLFPKCINHEKAPHLWWHCSLKTRPLLLWLWLKVPAIHYSKASSAYGTARIVEAYRRTPMKTSSQPTYWKNSGAATVDSKFLAVLIHFFAHALLIHVLFGFSAIWLANDAFAVSECLILRGWELPHALLYLHRPYLPAELTELIPSSKCFRQKSTCLFCIFALGKVHFKCMLRKQRPDKLLFPFWP